jgi:TolB-like protein
MRMLLAGVSSDQSNAEALISHRALFRELFVIGRNSSFTYKCTSVDIRPAKI